MTKEVMIAIRGLQVLTEAEEDRIEVIFPGEYRYRNGKHYLVFEEAIEGVEQASLSTIKISDHTMELIRKGPVGTRMMFEEGRKHVSSYQTPFGSMKAGVLANRIRLLEQEDRLEVDVTYLLDLDGQFISENRIVMTACSRERAEIHL